MGKSFRSTKYILRLTSCLDERIIRYRWAKYWPGGPVLVGLELKRQAQILVFIRHRWAPSVPPTFFSKAISNHELADGTQRQSLCRLEMLDDGGRPCSPKFEHRGHGTSL